MTKSEKKTETKAPIEEGMTILQLFERAHNYAEALEAYRKEYVTARRVAAKDTTALSGVSLILKFGNLTTTTLDLSAAPVLELVSGAANQLAVKRGADILLILRTLHNTTAALLAKMPLSEFAFSLASAGPVLAEPAEPAEPVADDDEVQPLDEFTES